MRITHVHLPCTDPAAGLAFYGEVLQLPVASEQVRIGWSVLQLTRGSDVGSAHLAFNVLPARFEAACDWLSQRAAFLSDAQGTTRFALGGAWQSQSVYFAGPDGAVLELIARAPLPAQPAPQGAFSAREVLCISEVGLPSAQVSAVVAAAQRDFGLRPLQPPSAEFAALGDHTGLLIAVDAQRRWFPQQRQLPFARGVRVVVDGVRPGQVLGDAAGWEVRAL
ncbi:catechol 2,3-dioxygenase-like lactoylglutathione lyase family enzyme [Xanthomonas sacchari]|uniref:VOC family protein n=1 Tax=Xanthomonas sacchari TaxID=56458 RepID=UPI0027868A33|nr:VOC family protein [Xanthomonas sacchari]MDQ1090954.1 catechol 2,3-dioxygenase-like lactoylglutathione lyase family enzyme [Xanthomonas sacchari]